MNTISMGTNVLDEAHFKDLFRKANSTLKRIPEPYHSWSHLDRFETQLLDFQRNLERFIKEPNARKQLAASGTRWILFQLLFAVLFWA